MIAGRDDDRTARGILRTVHDDVRPLVESWYRHLRAERKSYRTVENYVGTVRDFTAWCAATGHPHEPQSQSARDVQSWIVAQLDEPDDARRPAVGTVVLRFRCLQQWFRWLTEEDEIPESPMIKLRAPRLDEKPVPVFTDDELRALLDVTSPRPADWLDKRDHAIIRLFIDSGMRLGEMVGIEMGDVDLDASVVLVTGKGDRRRIVPFGSRTAQALDRYRRDRAKRPQSDQPQFWLGTRGTLGANGLDAMLKARAGQAGVEGMHAHRFRHTLAHRWLRDGGTEGALMRNAGWKNPAMLQRYGRSAADERARGEHRRIAPGDSL